MSKFVFRLDDANAVNQWGFAMCDALNLDKKLVKSINLKLSSEGLGIVEVEMYLDSETQLPLPLEDYELRRDL